MHMRMHINLDDELAEQIDQLAGPRGRSRYIREAIAARVETDRRVAARRRLVGSMPDFAPGVTAETISEERKREAARREAQLAPHWQRD
jgi:predicted transcriptional regulator